ncbi:MAG: nucleotidyltransferase domain-containing protein [Phycisphaerae bacterium]
MVRRLGIDVPTERLADFCRRHHIRKLMLFGSVLRHDFGAKSDVDVLMEFVPNQGPGYLRLG